MKEQMVQLEVLLPYDKGDEVNRLHEVGKIEYLNYEAEGVRVKGMVPTEVAMRLRRWDVDAERKEGEVQVHDSEDIDWVRIGKGRH